MLNDMMSDLRKTMRGSIPRAHFFSTWSTKKKPQNSCRFGAAVPCGLFWGVSVSESFRARFALEGEYSEALEEQDDEKNRREEFHHEHVEVLSREGFSVPRNLVEHRLRLDNPSDEDARSD